MAAPASLQALSRSASGRFTWSQSCCTRANTSALQRQLGKVAAAEGPTTAVMLLQHSGEAESRQLASFGMSMLVCASTAASVH